jgi:hypothetical protein
LESERNRYDGRQLCTSTSEARPLQKEATMGEKMPERTKAIVVNVSIVAGLLLCYFRGYPPKVILLSGLFLLVLANVLMHLKRRRISN